MRSVLIERRVRGHEAPPRVESLDEESPRAPARAPRVVAVGGGTGLPAVLQGLCSSLFPRGPTRIEDDGHDCLTAIVSTADDGGSSGRLRRAYRLPAPGDIRNCLVALASERSDLASVFDFRFNGGDPGLHGHSLGNLILTALWKEQGDFARAVDRAGRLLGIRGRVLPATLDDITLVADYQQGGTIEGESRIAGAHRVIRRVRLAQEGARVLPQAREAIARADLIVIGPGSLYTSLIPVLLIRDLADSITRTPARVVLVMNLMTEPGETDGYTSLEVLEAILRHAPEVRINDVLLNNASISSARMGPYSRDGAFPIPTNVGGVRSLGCRPVERDLLDTGPLIRHDPRKLAEALTDLVAESRS